MILRIILGGGLAGLIFLFVSYSEVEVEEKINGTNLVAPPFEIDADFFEPIKAINANWVAVIPYGFSREGQPELQFDHPRQWWGERKGGSCRQISLAKTHGLKVMFKPHVWVRGQGWAGDFDLSNDADWKIWERDYERYILTFAGVADSLNVEMLCIGTEFRKAVQQRPDFWRKLIRQVRQVYSGKLTYAANWDNYQNVVFWDEMDYIGIDAYFPISQKESPSVQELEEGWKKEMLALERFSSSYDRPVLFTEFGYQSVRGAAGNHWEVDKDILDMRAQRDAYEALFRVCWDKSWFAGGFFWKWHFNGHGGPDDPGWTPQGKPALSVVREWYAKYR